MKEGETFTLGVNYWPRRKAMYWWSQLKAGEVRDEFARLTVNPAAFYDTATAPQAHLPDLYQADLSGRDA